MCQATYLSAPSVLYSPSAHQGTVFASCTPGLRDREKSQQREATAQACTQTYVNKPKGNVSLLALCCCKRSRSRAALLSLICSSRTRSSCWSCSPPLCTSSSKWSSFARAHVSPACSARQRYSLLGRTASDIRMTTTSSGSSSCTPGSGHGTGCTSATPMLICACWTALQTCACVCLQRLPGRALHDRPASVASFPCCRDSSSIGQCPSRRG